MCGICGRVGKPQRELLKAMADALIHRGPDAEGFYLDADAGLGARRLRIIDLGGGDQPIHNEDKTLWIVFNGEIYNFKELRLKLKEKGHLFYTQTDTETIIHLYEEYGEECVEYLEGMFVFAIWDKANKALFIARDRLGIKPLYYHYKGNRFIFASELKALIKDKTISLEINPQALSHFFSFLYVPSPFSIFEGINKLPPAHRLFFKEGKLKVERYWDLRFERGEKKIKAHQERDYLQRLNQLLKEAVKKRLISDVPLGVFLSGGIDSSTIVAMMRQLSSSAIKTFSIGYSKKDKTYNELDYAQTVAGHFATEHHMFIVKPKIIELLPEVAWCLDEPFADPSAILTFLIAKEARAEITVALTGIGGDEVFGGYPRYLGARLSLGYQKVPYFLRRAVARLAPFIREGLTSPNRGSRIKRFLKGGLLSNQERYISWMQCFDKREELGIFNRELKERIVSFDHLSLHRSYFNRANIQDYLDKIFYLDLNTYLVDDLLHMGDRMSMANSLEVRVPFCDRKLVEFSAAVPAQLKLSKFRLKGLLKESLKGVLPPAILNRPKRGFMVPAGRWIREELRGYIQDVLSREEVKKVRCFDYKAIEKILKEHFNGRENYADQIWALLVFKLWHDTYKRL